ncbi:organic hydroperoxide resistance protein [Corynebacterium sp. MC-04]|uniref:Organic hydroperoxide resistance protein n=1 Tax=Corynebacterium parakroppenstedtii TaxID=2828363 RepID=A0ABS9HKY4_9CORY|nr:MULTISPECIES: organic hydroperoxide resistance protein [Corynebacterium]KXB49912.1 peroxiredoxin, Ohr subfamily [Corynebacterium kroppenstedtii]MBY0789474.1 organic hydroperoxide resistance protein [Corynebacterium parakroppenstedtii]MBY0793638.1 organic hydroperoxide resistance protein [Corynebacterium parakroppenstedtii]MBY0797114.1 organic hydroperoxide resistance protein [Corynebacterium parakroppenstedtii]MCF6770482.1 organic hydroperoxide resistance protein [Corynebacterium parakroppe
MSDALYTARVTSTGGGRDGHVASDDGHIDLDVRPPKEMGGSGDGTNPEQLVAAGWAACFNSALQMITKQSGVDVSKAPEVAVECSLVKDDKDGGFKISATLDVTLFGVSDDQARELAEKADAMCPYSKAFRGDSETVVRAHVG